MLFLVFLIWLQIRILLTQIHMQSGPADWIFYDRYFLAAGKINFSFVSHEIFIPQFRIPRKCIKHMLHKTFFFNLHTWEHHWREATKGAGCSGSVIFRGWLEGSLHRQCLAIKISCSNFLTNNNSLLICFVLELSFFKLWIIRSFPAKTGFPFSVHGDLFYFLNHGFKKCEFPRILLLLLYVMSYWQRVVLSSERLLQFPSDPDVLNLRVRLGNPPALPVHSQLLFPIRSKSTFPKSYQSGLFSINCINLDAKDLAINSRILVPLYGICKLVVVCVSANYFTSGWVLLLQVSCRIVLLQWKVIHLVVINERHWMLRHWNSGLRHV